MSETATGTGPGVLEPGPGTPESLVTLQVPAGSSPGADEARAVLALVDRAATADGFSAVNEAGRLVLSRVETGREHLIRHDPDSGRVVAYASLDLEGADLDGADLEGADLEDADRPDATPPTTPSPAGTVGAELVVDPADRRRGIGAALLRDVLDRAAVLAPGAAFSVWAHRDTAAARALALAAGLVPHRTLLLLHRPPAPLPDVAMPPGVRVAAFRPGVDEAAWLAVNTAAFATHPEQGRWTLADVADREAEAWFDPEGLLLGWSDGEAERAGAAPRLLGSHWTKIPDGQVPGAAPVVGEVYVLGVSPDAHTRGLGTALAVAGLASLAARGVGEVELYVESDNDRALGIYHRLGFVEASRDVAWGTTLAARRP